MRCDFRLIGLVAVLPLLAGCHLAEEPEDDMPAPSFQGPQVNRITPPPPSSRFPTGQAALATSVPLRSWRYIIIHHSDTKTGCAASFDKYHRETKGWAGGLGYDFVIGNGTGSGDGVIEAGPRWTGQMDGAHAGVEKYNKEGIGICLVGNFNQDRPTPAQSRALIQLTAYLMRTFHIPPQRVLGHRDIRKTDCPGKYLSVPALRKAVGGP